VTTTLAGSIGQAFDMQVSRESPGKFELGWDCSSISGIDVLMFCVRQRQHGMRRKSSTQFHAEDHCVTLDKTTFAWHGMKTTRTWSFMSNSHTNTHVSVSMHADGETFDAICCFFAV
jgi:hypothetical protein